MTLQEQARALADRPYKTCYEVDFPSGSYVAYHPELPGCTVQSNSLALAKATLDAFRVDYIEHLLMHNLPVPSPATTEDQS